MKKKTLLFKNSSFAANGQPNSDTTKPRLTIPDADCHRLNGPIFKLNNYARDFCNSIKKHIYLQTVASRTARTYDRIFLAKKNTSEALNRSFSICMTELRCQYTLFYVLKIMCRVFTLFIKSLKVVRDLHLRNFPPPPPHFYGVMFSFAETINTHNKVPAIISFRF